MFTGHTWAEEMTEKIWVKVVLFDDSSLKILPLNVSPSTVKVIFSENLFYKKNYTLQCID